MSSRQKKKSDSAPVDAPQTVAEAPAQPEPTPPEQKPDREFLHVATLPVVAGEDEKRVGRPFGFTEELAEEILDAIVGGASLREIGERDNMPSTKTIARWRRRIPEFDQKVIAAVKMSVLGFEDHAVAASRGLGEGDARTDIRWAELQIKTDLAIANQRRGDLRKMAGSNDAPPNPEDAKLIEGDYEVVETDDARFMNALRNWEKSTGIQSQAVAKPQPAEKQ